MEVSEEEQTRTAEAVCSELTQQGSQPLSLTSRQARQRSGDSLWGERDGFTRALMGGCQCGEAGMT